ncbi:MAG TPA: hypothetical protein VNF24_00885 [Candidatus Acidoferrales bacterium]|nr:hypothetical protein [Candidatus Acidoferrales bacterium]
MSLVLSALETFQAQFTLCPVNDLAPVEGRQRNVRSGWQRLYQVRSLHPDP